MPAGFVWAQAIRSPPKGLEGFFELVHGHAFEGLAGGLVGIVALPERGGIRRGYPAPGSRFPVVGLALQKIHQPPGQRIVLAAGLVVLPIKRLVIQLEDPRGIGAALADQLCQQGHRGRILFEGHAPTREIDRPG